MCCKVCTQPSARHASYMLTLPTCSSFHTWQGVPSFGWGATGGHKMWKIPLHFQNFCNKLCAILGGTRTTRAPMRSMAFMAACYFRLASGMHQVIGVCCLQVCKELWQVVLIVVFPVLEQVCAWVTFQGFVLIQSQYAEPLEPEADVW
jgi:hypothetical protein